MIEVTSDWYLTLSAILFSIGFLGMMVRKNALIMFMCIELMLNAVNLTFITASKHLGSVDGQIAVFFVLVVAAAQMIGADLAYMGTRFISTQECLSPDAYKQMLTTTAAGDIVLTDAVTGVNANFIKQSLVQSGYDLDNLDSHGEVDINKELAEALDPRQNSAKPWRDLWSAGHGVGSIKDIPSVASLVATLQQDYATAITAQNERAQPYL